MLSAWLVALVFSIEWLIIDGKDFANHDASSEHLRRPRGSCWDIPTQVIRPSKDVNGPWQAASNRSATCTTNSIDGFSTRHLDQKLMIARSIVDSIEDRILSIDNLPKR